MGGLCSSISNSEISNLTSKMEVIGQLAPGPLSQTDVEARSPDEILDDDMRDQIIETIAECTVNIPQTYYAERDRIVDEMRRSAPNSYLGLHFSDYPDVNGSKVNEMARKTATSDEVKQEISDKVNERIEPSFESRTGDWSPIARGLARPLLKAFVEKLVNEAVDNIILE